MNKELQIPLNEAAQMTWPAFCERALRERNQEVPRDPAMMVRAALSSVAGVGPIQGIVNATILQGFTDEPDTTSGWVRVVDLPSYTAGQLGIVDDPPRLAPVPRGGSAPVVSFGLSAERWQLARFGAQFALSEEDLLNGQSIGLSLVAYEQLGRAARRLVSDLVYSVVLQNPTLDDADTLFSAGRGNYATAALDATSLDAAIGALVNMVREDEDGIPTHRGLSPRYLIVPGQLLGAARRLVTDMDGMLEVRGESRLSAAGLLDPRDDETIRAGSAASWMLTCPKEQGAGILLGALGGNLSPRIRTFELADGEWGLGWDVSLPLACAAVDAQTVYFSNP